MVFSINYISILLDVIITGPILISFLQKCFEVVPGPESDPATLTHWLASLGNVYIQINCVDKGFSDSVKVAGHAKMTLTSDLQKYQELDPNLFEVSIKCTVGPRDVEGHPETGIVCFMHSSGLHSSHRKC